MRHFARISLGMFALGLITPITASAQSGAATASGGYLPDSTTAAQPAAPAGYQPASAAQPAPASSMGMNGKPMAAPAADATPALQHIHRWRTICPACAAKTAGPKPTNVNMPPGKIVGCAHSKNGMCTACKAAYDQPGEWVQTSAPAPNPPGRAVAASSAPARVGGYDDSMGDPAPVGVVQAGYSPSYGSMPMQAPTGSAMPANAPGKAVAESAPGHDFYHEKSNNGFPHPHILGHLFGWSGIGAEHREEKAAKKAEAHARLTYDPNAPSGVDELPASAVFDKKK
jgi:hypothetical protein